MKRGARDILVVAAVLAAWPSAMGQPAQTVPQGPATAQAPVVDADVVAAPTSSPAADRYLSTQPVLGGAEESNSVARGSGSDCLAILRTLAALAAVLGLILLLRWVLARTVRGRWLTGPAAVRVLWRREVGRHNQLLLVQLDQRLILVGAGQAGMTTLAELIDPRQVQRVMAELAGGPAERTVQPGPAGQRPDTPGQGGQV